MSASDPTETGTIVGILHPGEMGASVGGALRQAGITVQWAGQGRGPDTVARAEEAGLEDAGSLDALVAGCDVLLVICPPHAAVDLAKQVAGLRFAGIYVDANAIAPETARGIAEIATAAGSRFVDGDLIGGPVQAGRGPRLFLSGDAAQSVARLFAGTQVTAIVIGGGVEASALKMCYAAWTKGTSALLLAIRALAQSSGVDAALLAEWSRSQPDLAARGDAAVGMASRGWRYAAEMSEIASAFARAGLPEGFGLAAADIYGRLAGFKGGHPSEQEVVDAISARRMPTVPD